LPERLVVAMKAPATIAVHEAARRRGDELAERVDAVLQRHATLAHVLLGEPVPTSPEHALALLRLLLVMDRLGGGRRVGCREGILQAFLELVLELFLGQHFVLRRFLSDHGRLLPPI
jgi:hypothetical protein